MNTCKNMTRSMAAAAICTMLCAAAHCEPILKSGDKLAFMGDSITQFGNSKPVGYVNLVMKGLEVAGIQATKIPAGVSGHKSNQMKNRLQRDVLDKHPQVMTFSCGVNDVWHGASGVPLMDYCANVSNILDRCAEAGVKVVVLTATVIGEDLNNANNQKLAAYNDFLRAEAAARKLPLADLNADIQAFIKSFPPGHKGNKATGDGVHMAWEGDKVMARGVLLALGIPESKMPEIEAAWRKMPGFWEYRIPVSADEAKALDEQAKAKGCKVADLFRAALLGE